MTNMKSKSRRSGFSQTLHQKYSNSDTLFNDKTLAEAMPINGDHEGQPNSEQIDSNDEAHESSRGERKDHETLGEENKDEIEGHDPSGAEINVHKPPREENNSIYQWLKCVPVDVSNDELQPTIGSTVPEEKKSTSHPFKDETSEAKCDPDQISASKPKCDPDQISTSEPKCDPDQTSDPKCDPDQTSDSKCDPDQTSTSEPKYDPDQSSTSTQHPALEKKPKDDQEDTAGITSDTSTNTSGLSVNKSLDSETQSLEGKGDTHICIPSTGIGWRMEVMDLVRSKKSINLVVKKGAGLDLFPEEKEKRRKLTFLPMREDKTSDEEISHPRNISRRRSSYIPPPLVNPHMFVNPTTPKSPPEHTHGTRKMSSASLKSTTSVELFHITPHSMTSGRSSSFEVMEGDEPPITDSRGPQPKIPETYFDKYKRKPLVTIGTYRSHNRFLSQEKPSNVEDTRKESEFTTVEEQKDEQQRLSYSPVFRDERSDTSTRPDPVADILASPLTSDKSTRDHELLLPTPETKKPETERGKLLSTSTSPNTAITANTREQNLENKPSQSTPASNLVGSVLPSMLPIQTKPISVREKKTYSNIPVSSLEAKARKFQLSPTQSQNDERNKLPPFSSSIHVPSSLGVYQKQAPNKPNLVRHFNKSLSSTFSQSQASNPIPKSPAGKIPHSTLTARQSKNFIEKQPIPWGKSGTSSVQKKTSPQLSFSEAETGGKEVKTLVLKKVRATTWSLFHFC
ncbi:proteoglycan 4-like [Limulus polyphemus]|uniref:Proteoglycan 4-like n=1 Tax=Limulus polyphemus TaxID=6850 RepID=A0ABM1TM89_LIMPO|nr:proteoglycan 4-like [Limulus polyphemus]